MWIYLGIKTLNNEIKRRYAKAMISVRRRKDMDVSNFFNPIHTYIIIKFRLSQPIYVFN